MSEENPLNLPEIGTLTVTIGVPKALALQHSNHYGASHLSTSAPPLRKNGSFRRAFHTAR